jgi:hypothetical protein
VSIYNAVALVSFCNAVTVNVLHSCVFPVELVLYIYNLYLGPYNSVNCPRNSPPDIASSILEFY